MDTPDVGPAVPWSTLQGRMISDLGLSPDALMHIEQTLDPDVCTGERPITGEEVQQALLLAGEFKPYRPRLVQCS